MNTGNVKLALTTPKSLRIESLAFLWNVSPMRLLKMVSVYLVPSTQDPSMVRCVWPTSVVLENSYKKMVRASNVKNFIFLTKIKLNVLNNNAMKDRLPTNMASAWIADLITYHSRRSTRVLKLLVPHLVS